MPDAKDKIPKRVDLTGVTFQGKQLSTQALEEAERRSDFMEKERRKEIGEKVIILRRQHTKARGAQDETRKVSRRAKYFTKGEIRKEYGLMEKPYPTKVENILWCILNKGPIDMRGIADEMNYNDYGVATRSLSGPLSAIYKALGPKKPHGVNWMARALDGKRNFYSMKREGAEKSVEVLYAKHKEITSGLARERVTKRRQRVKELIAQDKKKAEEKKGIDVSVDVGQAGEDQVVSVNAVMEVIQDAVVNAIGKSLGVEIRVTGAVKILFGLIKEE